MSDLISFSRKIGDDWTVQDNERIKKYILKFRAKCSFKSKGKAVDEIIILLREEYPDYSPDKRSDGALARRIESLDKVLAGEVEKSTLMKYDEPFYNKLPRDTI